MQLTFQNFKNSSIRQLFKKMIYIKTQYFWVWYEIPKLKIPTGQNPETQNPEIQNPDRFKIPTGSKSRQVKIPTGQNPDISLAAKFQYTCVTQSVLYLFIHNIFAPTLSTIKTL